MVVTKRKVKIVFCGRYELILTMYLIVDTKRKGSYSQIPTDGKISKLSQIGRKKKDSVLWGRNEKILSSECYGIY